MRHKEKRIRGVANLVGYKVGVVEADAAQGILEARGGLNIEVFAGIPPALFALLSGQIDALAYPEPIVWKVAKDARLEDRIEVAGEPLRTIKLAFATRKEEGALLKMLDSAMREYVGTAEYRELYTRWFSEPEPYWNASRIAWIVGPLLLLAILGMTLWHYRSVIALNRQLLASIAQRDQLERDLRQSQKMEAVGQLTGGIAHDFNNVLGIIIGNLELIQHQAAAADSRLHAYAEKALKASKRGADLTRKLLGFSRKSSGEEQVVSVNEFIRGMEHLLTRSLTVAIRITTKLEERVWPTRIDPGDLEDAILNLALNARDAMPNGGELIIETVNQVIDEFYVQHNPQATVGEFVSISFSDTGQGMSPEIRERALEPFFTTKEMGKGTGLGLAMVYGFLKRSGGYIKLYSEVGVGTTVRLYLPRAIDWEERERKLEAQTELPRGSETILIVDDEEALCHSVAEHLQQLGYRTFAATSSGEALRLLALHDEIDLLFTDIIMAGGMDGYQLALTVHRSHPELRILLTSGFTKNREVFVNGEGAYLSSLIANLLHKPYSRTELAGAIRRALDGEPAG